MRLFICSFILCGLWVNSAFAVGPMSPIKRYADIKATLVRLAQENPDQVEVFDLGVADSGEVIQGIRVGHGGLHNLVVGTHHGNEYGAAEVAEAFAKDIAANPIAGQTIYVVPVLNTSGYDNRSRQERAGGGSYEPNRDYPGPCGTSGPFHLKSTKALADFLDRIPVVNSVTLHTYYPGVLYPWGISTHDLDTGYTDIFIELGHLATHVSGYKVGNSTEELYPADGTFEDYAYWKHGIWSLLFEMGRTHSPSQGQIEQLIADNVPGIRNFFMNAPTVRAPNHQFTGKCNGLSAFLDRRDE